MHWSYGWIIWQKGTCSGGYKHRPGYVLLQNRVFILVFRSENKLVNFNLLEIGPHGRDWFQLLVQSLTMLLANNVLANNVIGHRLCHIALNKLPTCVATLTDFPGNRVLNCWNKFLKRVLGRVRTCHLCERSFRNMRYVRARVMRH